MEKVDIVIIGAGVVGLALAARLAAEYKDIIVIEKHESFGQETSSRNSEVIHTGIYYPRDSLKARLCVRGNSLLYSYCLKHDIPFRKTGKLIVATDPQEEVLIEELFQKAGNNGVENLSIINKRQMKNIEPLLDLDLAIYSPNTGILDTHMLMKSMEANAEQQGVIFAYGCEAIIIEKNNNRYKVGIIDADGEKLELDTAILINSAGLQSEHIAGLAGIDTNKAGYQLYYSKGEYFKISGIKPNFMRTLVYPVPGSTSLGIHTVLDLQGQLKLGPNAFYVDEIDYSVDQTHKQDFYESARKYLPFLQPETLVPDMAGIRAKRQAPGVDFADFIICNETQRGLSGFINLIGIESPGLTSCLAIADYLADLIN